MGECWYSIIGDSAPKRKYEIIVDENIALISSFGIWIIQKEAFSFSGLFDIDIAYFHKKLLKLGLGVGDVDGEDVGELDGCDVGKVLGDEEGDVVGEVDG